MVVLLLLLWPWILRHVLFVGSCTLFLYSTLLNFTTFSTCQSASVSLGSELFSCRRQPFHSIPFQPSRPFGSISRSISGAATKTVLLLSLEQLGESDSLSSISTSTTTPKLTLANCQMLNCRFDSMARSALAPVSNSALKCVTKRTDAATQSLRPIGALTVHCA